MKKILSLTLPALMVMTMMSCSDDNELSGTVWVGNYHSKKVEGCALRFISDEKVYVIDWEYEYPGDEADSILCNYTYDISEGTITYQNREVANFKVKNGNTMTYNDILENDTYTLRKI